MIDSDAFLPIINQRNIVIKKTIKEVRKIMTNRIVNDALNIKNNSSNSTIRNLSINLSVLIYREEINIKSET